MFKRSLIMIAVLAGTACRPTEAAEPSQPAAPPQTTATAEAAPAAPTEPAGATMKIEDQADYVAKGSALFDGLIAVFSQGGTDCDRLAAGVTRYTEDNSAVLVALSAYEKEHPDSLSAFDAQTQAKQDELEAAILPVFQACSGHEGLNAAIERLTAE